MADASATVAFVDTFDDDRVRGRVIGSSPGGGVLRGGVDVEHIISIDHGALRIRPLLRSGWGRANVSYGPYHRRNGLMVAVLVLNGHNTSQSERLPESFVKRLARWLQGHGDRRFGLLRRLGQWLRYKRKRYMIRRLRWWWRMAYRSVDIFDENLAVGWFGSGSPGHPNESGNAFVMHAGLGDNGELWTRSAADLLPVTKGLQNLPMCYVVVLRERGAAYYIASVPGAHAVGTLPRVRPVSIDPFADDPVVHAGVHQSALGQVGFRVDTRVYAVQVEHVSMFDAWFGTAHAADSLVGDGNLDGSSAEVGGRWSTVDGTFERHADGTGAPAASATAVVDAGAASGLVHAVVEVGSCAGEVGLVWRFDPDRGCYRFLLAPDGCRLVVDDAGTTTVLASSGAGSVRPNAVNSMQIVDHGTTATFALNGHDVFGGSVPIELHAGATGVGVCSSRAPEARFTWFEAHALDVDLDGVLKLPEPWYAAGEGVVAGDELDGVAGADLAGRRTTIGNKVWHRQYGAGRILTTGSSGAVVDASVDRPNPGNLAYTIDWDHPEFADLAVDITPPGSARGEGHRGRTGLVFWQDPRNFFMVSMWLEDDYDGAAISAFFHLDGFEEIYDAVWTMVGTKVFWGVRTRLRVVFDGMHLMAFVDDEPVQYRALTDIYPDRGPLAINRVGLSVNWEWGDDTGSTVANFVARTREPGS